MNSKATPFPCNNSGGLRIGQPGWRDAAWNALEACQSRQPWDLVIVGGGITGVGILREAVRAGLKALLVEQRDFAWGTSSRSSKMVHGGLRYLAQGDFKLTRDSVRERQRLMQEAPGLVEPLRFLMPHYPGQFPGPGLFQKVLAVYDGFAGKRQHRLFTPTDAMMLTPGLRQDGLRAISQFTDAVTDDARLVLRVLRESLGQGGLAMNYVAAGEILRRQGKVSGLRLHDQLSDKTLEVRAHAVINATGAWSDVLRQQLGGAAKLRPLRGSHLVIPFWRLPLAWSLSFFHPEDKRPVFAFPWEGVTVIGTTDLDQADLNREPRITEEEVDYLLAAVNTQFPSANLRRTDIQATYAGVRPVINTGASKPSQEKREHAIWDEQGMITVAGGKLTTFRLIALDALSAAAIHLPDASAAGLSRKRSESDSVFSTCDQHALDEFDLPAEKKQRLLGRFGREAFTLLDAAAPAERQFVGNSDTLWAELRWSCQEESVVHLEDLMLRRTRLGLLLPKGGAEFLPRIGELCRSILGWDEARWQQEQSDYLALWAACYSPLPNTAEVVP